MTGRTLALLYHDVVESKRYSNSGFPGAGADIYKLDAVEFQTHLNTLAQCSRNAPVLCGQVAGQQPRELLLTFDDGGESAFTHVAPMLSRRGWKAHFFVTTNFIGTPGFLGRGQIQELRTAGHVIGTHTCSHPPRMARCSRTQLLEEWRSSVRRLEDILGERVIAGSVPGGYFSRLVAESAAEAGLQYLFTSEPVTIPSAVGECTVIGRFTIQQGATVDGVRRLAEWNLLPRLQQWAFWNTKKVLKAAGGTGWLAVRDRILTRQMGATEVREDKPSGRRAG
jgi:peptidoglycan/xylan/chitin deacetylase (PgdA/CDA1 family)